MKCVSCGYETEQDYAFCPECGAAAQQAVPQVFTPEQPVNSAAEKVLQALKHPLFLVLCILMSASCALTLVTSGPDVLSILFTVFLWLTYAKSRQDIADASHLRCISGTVYAQYVIVNVCAILLIVVGGILALCFGVLAEDPSLIQEILSAIDFDKQDMAFLTEELGSLLGAVLFVVLMLVGILLLVINLFSNRYIHRFAKSVYQSVQTGNLALQHGKTAHGWLWVYGITSGVRLLGELTSGDLLTILSGAISCAMPIVAAILIKNALLDQE